MKWNESVCGGESMSGPCSRTALHEPAAAVFFNLFHETVQLSSNI